MKRPSRLAIIDHLTGLYNRRYFDKRLKKIIPEAKKKRKHFSLLMIDIDKFKDVNDKYGHLAGDKVLNSLAKVLKKSVRKPDICFRYGGDEIAVLLPGSEKKAAAKIIVRLKTKVEKYRFSIEGSSKLRLKLSVGLAIFPEDGVKPNTLIKKADELLYKVKARKKPKRRITEPFILETKLIPPVPKENTIARPRLLSSLKENLDKKLVLVIADAGYGKTTLLTQLIHDQKSLCVFYNLDKNDSHFAVFISYFLHGLELVQKDLVTRTKLLLKQGGEAISNYEMVMGTLINELMEKRGRKLFIILDDYHTLSESDLVHQALDYFIDHLPDNVHMVIGSRMVPPFASMPKWRSKQDLFELSRKRLRFTEEEIKTLLAEVYKIVLPEEELRRVSEKTEGWITGIQLILQYPGKDGRTTKEAMNGYLESNIPLFEYFANEIFRNESIEVQNFLKKTSIYESIIPEMCNKVLNDKDTSKILENLERKSLFLSKIGKNQYIYHGLFRGFLRHKLAETISSKELNNLHMEAARLYMKKQTWARAIRHFIEAEDYERAAKVIKKVGNDFIVTGRANILYHLMELLPRDTVNTYPSLFVYMARISRQWGKWDVSLVLFRKAQRIFHRDNDRNSEAEVLRHISNIYTIRGSYKKAKTLAEKALGLVEARNNRLKVKLLNSLSNSYFYMADLGAHERLLKKALSLCRRHKYPDLMVLIKGNLALAYMNADKLSPALGIYRDLFKSKLFIHNLPLTTVYYSNTAWIYMIMGEFELAKQFLEKAFEICVDINYKAGQCNALIGMGQFRQMVGEYDKALDYYNQTLVLNKDMKEKILNRRIWLGMAGYYLAKGELDKAEKYINNCLTIQEVRKNSLSVAQLSLTLGEIKLRGGDYEKAEEIILQSHRTFLKKGFGYDKLVSCIRLADLYWTKGDLSKMRIYLKKAITIAKQKRYDGILIGELNKNPRIFELAREANIESDYLSNLMKKIGDKPYFEVWMLGAFLVKINGHRILGGKWQTERAGSIFAYLLMKRTQVISRDRLINVFFPDLAPQKASQKLRMSLFFARKILGERDFLLYENKGYRINPKVKCWTDVDEFSKRVEIAERYAKDGKMAEVINQYLKAAATYEGDFLEDVYDDWCEEPRKDYRSIYIKILKYLAEYFYNQTSYEQSIEYYRKMVEKDKFLEEAYCGIMRGCAKIGNRKEIIRYFQKLTKILREELACEPLLQTKELYESLTQ